MIAVCGKRKEIKEKEKEKDAPVLMNMMLRNEIVSRATLNMSSSK